MFWIFISNMIRNRILFEKHLFYCCSYSLMNGWEVSFSWTSAQFLQNFVLFFHCTMFIFPFNFLFIFYLPNVYLILVVILHHKVHISKCHDTKWILFNNYRVHIIDAIVQIFLWKYDDMIFNHCFMFTWIVLSSFCLLRVWDSVRTIVLVR